MRICVVDDDPKMVTFMTAVLEDAGHTVISNVSPMMAIPDIIKNAPDCLVTDLVMAELDGVELCHHLRGRDEAKDLAIIFVTAQRSSYWQKKAIDANRGLVWSLRAAKLYENARKGGLKLVKARKDTNITKLTAAEKKLWDDRIGKIAGDWVTRFEKAGFKDYRKMLADYMSK